jgi:biopolymer transport protein ExbD
MESFLKRKLLFFYGSLMCLCLIQKTMAQLQLEPISTGKKNRTRKAPLKIDMTPMVDLGFLLITFFIFTTTISEAKGTTLYLPNDSVVTNDPTVIGESNALTILLSGTDSIYFHHGKWNEATTTNQVQLTNYSLSTGIGNTIREKQKLLGDKRNELLLMIKPLDNSSYKNLMNALDEVLINDVKKYAIMEVTDEEKKWVSTQAK